jgi:type IV pilus assembly protein PilA
MSSVKKQKGFTLLELLVVISIVGLLSSVVLASFGGARERSRIAAGLQTSASLYRLYGIDSIAYFDFEGDSTSITDSIGNGYSIPTPSACSVVVDSPNPGGKGLQCNGTGGFLLTPSNTEDRTATYATGASFTYALWFKPTADQPDNNRMLLGRNGFHSGISVTTNNRVRGFLWFETPTSQMIITESGRTLETGKWYFIAYSVDSVSRTARLFIDGAQVGGVSTFPVGSGLYSSSNGTMPYFVASAGGGASGAMIGIIDKVGIYKRGLGVAEIQSIYALEAPKYKKTLAILESYDDTTGSFLK